MAYLAIALRVLLSAVFAAAAVGKARDRAAVTGLAGSLSELGLPRPAAGPAAVGIIVAEAAVVVLLWWPGAALVGAVAAAALLAAFTAGVARAVRRGVTSGCACFGAAPGRFTRVHVARNALLLALAGATVASVASAGPVEVGPQLAVAVTGAVVAAAAFVFWDDLAAVVIGGPVDVERS